MALAARDGTAYKSDKTNTVPNKVLAFMGFNDPTPVS